MTTQPQPRRSTTLAVAGRPAHPSDPPAAVDTTPDDAGEALIVALYQEHGRALLAYATRLLGERTAAEDVVQETLLRAWRNTQALVSGRGSVRGWLFMVARNIVIDQIRAKAARPGEVPEAPHRQPVEADHADAVVHSVVVLDALDRLSADHREVLRQIYYEGRTTAETGRALGLPVGTVKSRTYYALRMLRDLLGGRPPTLELVG